MQSIISEGKHILTCVEDVRFKKYGYEYDGMYIVLDNKPYLVYRDPDDGYRSYGIFEEIGEKSILTSVINEFPPQEVLFSTSSELLRDEDCGYVVSDIFKQEFTNEYGELILGVYTDYGEAYYPVGYVEYHPENLPQNKNRETTTWYATI